jgi:hypothetical protein
MWLHQGLYLRFRAVTVTIAHITMAMAGTDPMTLASINV